MARIDFARMYTVEHKIKAYDFGDVVPAYMQRLHDQWIRMISQEITGVLTGDDVRGRARLPVNDEDEDEDEDDYDEDDDDEDSDEKEAPASAGYSYRPTSNPYGSSYPTGGRRRP
jgi:hypothetical protein